MEDKSPIYKFSLKLLIGFVAFYQYFIRILLPNNRCIYQPSCSEYCIESLTKHGIIKGLSLSAKRVLSCHPASDGGEDPVP